MWAMPWIDLQSKRKKYSGVVVQTMAPAPVYPLRSAPIATPLPPTTHVRSTVFRITWLGLLCVHLACAFTYGHVVFQGCEDDHGCSSTIYGSLMMLLHGLAVVIMLLRSMWHGQLVFELPPFLGARKPTDVMSDDPLSVHAMSRYGLWLLWSVHSPYFDLLIVMRELIEVGLLTYQINQFLQTPVDIELGTCRWLTAMLILNCWSSPLIKFLVSKKRMRRLLCLCADAVFDVVFGIYTPIWIVGRWMDHQTFDDQMILAVLAWSLFSTLRSIQSFLQQLKDQHTAEQIHQKPTPRSDAPESKPFMWGILCCNMLLALWGLVIAGSQIALDYRLANCPCALYWSSWFDHAVYCQSLDIDCKDRTELYEQGQAIESVLEAMAVDFAALQFVTIRHCPQLVLPNRFASTLEYLDIVNCTILEPSITEQPSVVYNQSIKSLVVQDCHFANPQSLPTGLTRLAVDWDVTITHSNLQALPDDLDQTAWSQTWLINLSDNKLQAVPPVLLRLPQLRMLWLSGNAIPSLPSKLFRLPTLSTVDLSRNPIETIDMDNTTTISSTLTYLGLLETNLTQWPSDLLLQLAQKFDLRIDVEGSLCTQLIALDAYRTCTSSSDQLKVIHV